jgi:organic hydroperoxide reductase OsmC/OhrA
VAHSRVTVTNELELNLLSMKPLPHEYDVHLTGGPSGYAVLSMPGIPDLSTAPPADFDGPGDAWSPEHLLLAAVQTCFLFTLRSIARGWHVDFSNLDLDAAGTVDRHEGVTRFTEIVLRPRLVIARGTDREHALRMLEKSETHCLVSASLSTPIRMEPEVTEN